MKLRILLLFLFLFSYIENFSIDIRYLNDIFTIENIEPKQFSAVNKRDYTIRVDKIEKSSRKTYYLKPYTSQIFYSNFILNKNQIDNIKFELYYDIECYYIDLELLEKERKKRLEDQGFFDKAWNMIINNKEAILRTGFVVFEELTNPNSTAGKFFRNGNKVIGYYDKLISIIKNGIIDTEIDEIKSKLKNDGIDKLFTDKEMRAAIKGLDTYISNYTPSSSDPDFSDLDKRAESLFLLCSNIMINECKLNFDRDFNPSIDEDYDKVLNIDDECQNCYGKAKYNGCTRLRWINNRRMKYEISVEVGTTFLNFYNYKETYNQNILLENKYKTSKFDINTISPYYFRLTNSFGTKRNSNLNIPIQYYQSPKFKIEYITDLGGGNYSKETQFLDVKNIEFLLGWETFPIGKKNFYNLRFNFEIGGRVSLYKHQNSTSNYNINNSNVLNTEGILRNSKQFNLLYGAGLTLDLRYLKIVSRFSSTLFLKYEKDNKSNKIKYNLNSRSINLGLEFPLYRKFVK